MRTVGYYLYECKGFGSRYTQVSVSSYHSIIGRSLSENKNTRLGHFFCDLILLSALDYVQQWRSLQCRVILVRNRLRDAAGQGIRDRGCWCCSKRQPGREQKRETNNRKFEILKLRNREITKSRNYEITKLETAAIH